MADRENLDDGFVVDAGSKSNKKNEKSEEAKAPIIIKKVKKHAHGHHGGAWKIAFADFVTAMMAFFLLMWLIASLNKSQKAGLAEYFRQPIKVALLGGDSMGTRKISPQGGGANIDEKDGSVSASEKPTIEEKTSVDAASAAKAEEKKLEELKSEILFSMDNDPALAGLKERLKMDITEDGLRIQLLDEQNNPMFGMGSDKMSDEMKGVLAQIAKLVNSTPQKITIQGHTDAHPYSNPEELDMTNWELSTLRANAARRALVAAGMNETKVKQVAGYASTQLFDKSDPYSPKNRRISILVMNQKAEEKLEAQDEETQAP